MGKGNIRVGRMLFRLYGQEESFFSSGVLLCFFSRVITLIKPHSWHMKEAMWKLICLCLECIKEFKNLEGTKTYISSFLSVLAAHAVIAINQLLHEKI